MKLIDIIKENNSLEITEAPRSWINLIQGDAKTLKSANPALHGALSDVITFSRQDKNQLVGLTAKSPNKVVPLNSVDDLIYAVKTTNGITDKTLALLNQGLLKSSKTPANLINDIAKDLVGNEKFIKTYGPLTPKEMEKLLRQKGYSEPAISTLLKEAPKNPKFKIAKQKGNAQRKSKKTVGGKDKNLTPTTNGQNVPPQQKKTLLQKTKELINNVKVKKMSWKQLLVWGAGLGIGATALWWFFYESSDTLPDDIPENEPVESGWAPCIQELLKSGEGKIAKRPNGEISALVITNEYPQGLQFYNNGRVMDVAANKMGSWKCKGGVATLQEQVSDSQLASDVSKMIDLLDFPVSHEDLIKATDLLKQYVANGSGRKFLDTYKKSGGFGGLSSSLKSIVTYKPQSVIAKQNLVKVYNKIVQGSSLSEQETNVSNQKVGLKNIDITWDGSNKDNTKQDNSGNTQTISSKYTDCSSYDINKQDIPFGCKHPIVKEVQKCLGLEPKYQTGNFGPITMKALGGNVITKDSYDNIMANCGSSSNVSGNVTTSDVTNASGGYTPKGLGKVDASRFDYLNNPSSENPTSTQNSTSNSSVVGNTSNESPEEFYNRLMNEGLLTGDVGETVVTDANGVQTRYPPTKRIKYKGEELSAERLKQLDDILGGFVPSYRRIKQKVKGEDIKYVWLQVKTKRKNKK